MTRLVHWLYSRRVLECDPADPLVLRSMLQAAGPDAIRRYLAVQVAGSDAGGWEPFPSVAASEQRPLRHHNAQVLVLSGRGGWRAWASGHWRQAERVVLRWQWSFACGFAAAGFALQVLLGKLRFESGCRLRHGRERAWFLSFAVRRPALRRSARRCIPHHLGVAGLLEQLAARKVRYAVLRWFETLPTLPPGEDLDLLVADEDLPRVEALLEEGPGVCPCDLYTVSGLPGTDRDDLPYYPPLLAQEILAHTVEHPSGARVPDPQRHFLSLAYHVVYHKGLASGLPWEASAAADGGTPAASLPPGQHDYAGVLSRLADQLGWTCPPTLRGLDALLAERGWRPPRDMLVRLARRRPELKNLVEGSARDQAPPGLAVFLLRQAAVAEGASERLIERLRHDGFQILAVHPLSPGQSWVAGRTLRGGNWGRGPWPASGGPPAVAVVACDPEPIPPDKRQRRQHPELDNARLLCKARLREIFNQGRPRGAHCNVVHASDNAAEALDYLRCLMPERVSELCRQAEEVRRQFITPQPVIYSLSQYRRRSKTEIIQFGGRLAVKKTFKPQQRAYCAREAWALAHLSRRILAVPPLLDAGPDYVIYPYYRDVLRFRCGQGRLLPLEVARQAIAALRQVYEAGYALIDAHPENLVVDPEQGLKLIDFEFLYRYPRRPATFEASYDMVGCPADFEGPLPEGGAKCYARDWQPYIGLSLQSLLHDPPWLQQVKRGLYWLRSLPRLLPRRLRSWARQRWLEHSEPQPVPASPAPLSWPARADPARRQAA